VLTALRELLRPLRIRLPGGSIFYISNPYHSPGAT
jgi:hypothetical protein